MIQDSTEDPTMSEMCPQCKAIREMKKSVSTRQVTGSDGKIREIRTTSFHCETCGIFVRSEDEELSAQKPLCPRSVCIRGR